MVLLSEWFSRHIKANTGSLSLYRETPLLSLHPSAGRLMLFSNSMGKRTDST